MRIIALDVGDVWTGTALCDPLKIIAKPFQTVKTTEILKFLEQSIPEKMIDTIVIGLPKTMKDKESAQTKKVLEFEKLIKTKFDTIKIILWDERLSSKMAKSMQTKKAKKNDKHHQHSIAAAVILQNYLQFLTF